MKGSTADLVAVNMASLISLGVPSCSVRLPNVLPHFRKEHLEHKRAKRAKPTES